MSLSSVDINPSIGAIGAAMPDLGNGRVKGVLLPPAGSLGELDYLYQQLVVPVMASYPEQTRVSVRVFTEPGLTPEILTGFQQQHGGQTVGLEAYIPLGLGEITGLAYFGGNTPDRIPSPAIMAQEQACLAQAQAAAQSRPPHPLPQGYSVELVPPDTLVGLNDGDIAKLLEIYQGAYSGYLVPFTLEGVRQNAEHSAVGVVRNPNSEIVSVTMGEITPPIVRDLRMCEISDSATHPNLREADPNAKGVNFWAKQAVIEYLVQNEVDIIYAESRAVWEAVLRSNAQLGLEPCGFLPRACVIGSNMETVHDAQSGRFGDLVVMALLPEARERYQVS
jgi:hypothetical protein